MVFLLFAFVWLFGNLGCGVLALAPCKSELRQFVLFSVCNLHVQFSCYAGYLIVGGGSVAEAVLGGLWLLLVGFPLTGFGFYIAGLSYEGFRVARTRWIHQVHLTENGRLSSVL